MENVLRSKVLAEFKKLHQVRKCIFNEDIKALSEARKLINDGFKKNKNLKLKLDIEKEIQFAIDVREELKSNVVQAVEVKPGIYEANVRREILLDNHLYNPSAVITKSRGKKCSDFNLDQKQTE